MNDPDADSSPRVHEPAPESSGSGDAVLRFNGFQFDSRRGELRNANGAPLALRPKAEALLREFLSQPGRLLSKDRLIATVWPTTIVTDDSLVQCIGELRALLGDVGQRLITTVSRRGYRLEADVHSGTPAGAQGLRSVTPAARVYEFAAALDLSSMTTRQHERLPTLLAGPLPALLGREEDIAAVSALIDAHPLVTILGTGGVGKSLLAKHVLAARQASYSHGVCWLELADTAEPGLIPATLAAALGVRVEEGEPLDALCLAMAPLRMLIGLDSAEHVLSELANVVSRLLSAAPGLRFLVTTQAPLKLADEQRHFLGPLRVPAGPLPAMQALEYGAVAMFVERAVAADSRFTFSDAVAPGVVELCRNLDGLPLSLELAAARVSTLGVHWLTHAVGGHIDLLNANRDRYAPARQQSLRATLQWGHDLLHERERVVFRRLGVFQGGASLEQIRHVVSSPGGELDEWGVTDALQVLVERSLVVVLGVEGDAVTRYRLLDSPRAFAMERLTEAGELAALRRRHAIAMASQVDSDDEALSRPHAADPPHGDLSNARHALAWARQEGETAIEFQIGTLLLETLPRALHAERGALAIRCTFLMSTAELPRRLQCRAWLKIGPLWFNRHRRRSYEAALQAVRLARELDAGEPDRFLLYWALCQLARSPLRMKLTEEAVAAIREARHLEEPAWPASRLLMRARAEAFVAVLAGDMEEAAYRKRQVLALARACGSETSLDVCDLVDTELAAGNAAAAARIGSALVAALAGSRDQFGLAYAQLNLAAALLQLDDVTEARELAASGWTSGLNFHLQPYWADYLALLCALERRPRAAARLIGYANAGYADREQERSHNEAAAAVRTRALVDATLGVGEVGRLQVQGAALRDAAVPALAFETDDLA